ncbi:MAG TPA: hypothetical protein VFJ74_03625 [Gemmatimonadaceae bacterium]|nr:hypothetical protein [Gemmatimonadaceae bacterium]
MTAMSMVAGWQQAAAETPQAPAAPQAPQAGQPAPAGAIQTAPPALPGEPKVTVNPDGRMVIVSPEGHTTISYPDGRVVNVGPDGSVQQSGPPGSFEHQSPDDGAVVTMLGLGIIVAFFTGRWWTRRGMKRRGTAEGSLALGLPSEFGDRMDRIEHAVDSIAVEVERISEGQRFTTKLMSEMRSAPPQLGVGAIHQEAAAAAARREPVVVPAGERRS